MVFANEEESYSLEIPKETRYLNTASYDYSVAYLNSMIKSKKIILEVPFQRKQIWKADKASLLIESIIMNVPIPPLYFAEEENGDWLVIDGLQRLSSIRDFYDNEFSLRKLEILTELSAKKYKDLPPKAKSLLDDGLLRVNVIKKDSHKDIKYDIFMRLNRGAVTLNYQELRNCLYRGNLNDAAKELSAENKYYQRVLNQKGANPRYLDAELIIRYYALSDNLSVDNDGSFFVKDYRGKLVTYLNDYMSANKNCTPAQKEEYKKRFNDTMCKVSIVFDVHEAFRDISTENTKVYKTIADFIMLSFERMDIEYLRANKQAIISTLKSFLQLPEIRSALSVKTSDKDVLNRRINLWFKELGNAIHI